MGNPSRAFICQMCQRELPVSKKTESSSGREKNVCDDCQTRENGSVRSRRSSEEGSSTTEFNSEKGLFDEQGKLGIPDSSKDTRLDLTGKADDDLEITNQADKNDNINTVTGASPTFLYQGDEAGPIGKGELCRYQVELSETAMLEYEVRITSGPNADILVLNPKNLKNWIEGEKVRYFNDLSVFDTRDARVQGTITSGIKYIIIDNTARGEAKPPVLGDDSDGTIEFNFKYAVYR